MKPNPIDPLTPQSPAISPEYQSLLGLSGPVDENAALEEQIAQAIALRNKPRQHYSTWAGALAGGLGDVTDAINSKVTEGRLRGQQEPLQKQIQAGRRTLGEQAIATQKTKDDAEAEYRRAQIEMMQRQSQPGPWRPFGLGGQ